MISITFFYQNVLFDLKSFLNHKSRGVVNVLGRLNYSNVFL